MHEVLYGFCFNTLSLFNHRWLCVNFLFSSSSFFLHSLNASIAKYTTPHSTHHRVFIFLPFVSCMHAWLWCVQRTPPTTATTRKLLLFIAVHITYRYNSILDYYKSPPAQHSTQCATHTPLQTHFHSSVFMVLQFKICYNRRISGNMQKGILSCLAPTLCLSVSLMCFLFQMKRNTNNRHTHHTPHMNLLFMHCCWIFSTATEKTTIYDQKMQYNMHTMSNI